MTEETPLASPGDDGPTVALNAVRRGIAERLPGLIETVFRRYRDFAASDPPGGDIEQLITRAEADLDDAVDRRD